MFDCCISNTQIVHVMPCMITKFCFFLLEKKTETLNPIALSKDDLER